MPSNLEGQKRDFCRKFHPWTSHGGGFVPLEFHVHLGGNQSQEMSQSPFEALGLECPVSESTETAVSRPILE